MSDVLSRLIEILDRAGVAGQELANFADEVLGPKNPDTGLREGDSETASDSEDATDADTPAVAPPADTASADSEDATDAGADEGNETTPAE